MLALEPAARPVTIRVVGRPAPKGSIGALHVGTPPACFAVAKESSSKHLPPWQRAVRLAARMQTRGMTPFAGPVAVTVLVILPRPKSLPKSRTPAHVTRPDVDKLARSCLDPLTSILYHDDGQVVLLTAGKIVAAPGQVPGVAIRVQPVVDVGALLGGLLDG